MCAIQKYMYIHINTKHNIINLIMCFFSSSNILFMYILFPYQFHHHHHCALFIISIIIIVIKLLLIMYNTKWAYIYFLVEYKMKKLKLNVGFRYAPPLNTSLMSQYIYCLILLGLYHYIILSYWITRLFHAASSKCMCTKNYTSIWYRLKYLFAL